jgi:hypothetical protein
MAEWSPLRERLPQLLERLPGDLGCQQALEGSWENEEECLFAVLRQAIQCRGSGDPVTSLMLLEWLLDQGVEHPLVIDNLIRGLVDSDRFLEATLLLSSLADLDQGEVLQGATNVLLTHQQALRSNLLKHCDAQQLEPVGLALLETIPATQFPGRIFEFALQQIGVGGAALARTVLEELMHWGQWSLDALPVDLQRRWALLVVQVGVTFWQDLPSYREALQLLKGSDVADHCWQVLEVELMLQHDIGRGANALEQALQFLVEHPGHAGALTWLSAQQDVAYEQGLPGASADRVLMVDQALARDALILDHLRKLMDDPMELSPSS